MAKRSITWKLLLRPAIVLFLIWISFILAIKIIRFIWPSITKPRTENYRSFGIVPPSGYPILGIDVSRHQEDIDWKRVDSMRSDGKRISFVFIKATEGISRQDPSFERNWKTIKNTQLIRGAYHFYYPSRDALKQARNFITQVKLIKGDLPPVVDIEHSRGRSRKKICEGLSAFLKELENKYKVKPLIYTNLSFYNDYLAGEFDQYPLWISCYFDEDRFRTSCNHKWIFWQYSELGNVNGISGNVDFNVFNGNEMDLRKLCIP